MSVAVALRVQADALEIQARALRALADATERDEATRRPDFVSAKQAEKLDLMSYRAFLAAAAEGEGAITRTGRRTEGSYWRNVAANEVSKRYGQADASFGHRIKCAKWESNSHDGVSVNCCVCSESPRCSVLLHLEPDRYEHAVRVDLVALGQLMEMPLEAVYAPLTKEDDGAENPCHYLLLPEEGEIYDLFVKLNRLAETDFPKEKPRKPEDVEIWKEANRRLKLALDLRLDVKVEVA